MIDRRGSAVVHVREIERGAERVRGQKHARLEGLEAQAAAPAHRLQRLFEQALFSPLGKLAEPVRELAEEDLEQARDADRILASGGGVIAHWTSLRGCRRGLRRVRQKCCRICYGKAWGGRATRVRGPTMRASPGIPDPPCSRQRLLLVALATKNSFCSKQLHRVPVVPDFGIFLRQILPFRRFLFMSFSDRAVQTAKQSASKD